MTKKDYIRLSNALHSAMPAHAVESGDDARELLLRTQMYRWALIRDRIAETLAEDNPRFNAEKFKFACAGVK